MGVPDFKAKGADKSLKHLGAWPKLGKGDFMDYRSVRRLGSFLPVLFLSALMCGCATGKVLTLPEGPTRPAAIPAQKPEGAPAVAVLDFSWEGNPSSEIGRDFDNVRSIVWSGNPGKALADLLAAALLEKGIPTLRAAGESDIPAGVPSKVRGRVENFRVDVKRSRSVTVDIEAAVALNIQGTGPGAPPGWSTLVTSTFGSTEPLFFTANDVLKAINRAANIVAEEGVRRLVGAGVVAAPVGTGAEKTGQGK